MVADEIGEARVAAAEPSRAGRGGRGRRQRPGGEDGAEQARPVQELTPGDALRVEAGGGDGGVGPGGQLLLCHGLWVPWDPESRGVQEAWRSPAVWVSGS